MNETVRMSPRVATSNSQSLVTVTRKIPQNMRLPDDAQWKNKIKVRSSSSDNCWVVSQNISTGIMGCSCPGWKRHRKCKHIGSLGLPCGVRVDLKLLDQ